MMDTAEITQWRSNVDQHLIEVDQRLTKIETILEHVATKADLANLKVWMLSGIFGGVSAAVALAKIVL